MQPSEKKVISVNGPQERKQDAPSWMKQNDQETKGHIIFNIDKCEVMHLESLYSKQGTLAWWLPFKNEILALW